MQPPRNSWFKQLSKIVSCILILSVASCTCGPKKGGKVPEQNSKQVYIMLIHGIGDVYREGGEIKSGLAYLIDPLKKALGDGQGSNGNTKGDQASKKKTKVDIFAPARGNSISGSIKTQAEDMFKVLQTKGITQDDKLIIMGHSQGGAVAMTLYAMYMRDWKNMAIVSVQGALCGTPAADAQAIPHEVTAKVNEIVDYLRKDKNLDKIAGSINIDGVPLGHMLVGSGMDFNQEIKKNLPPSSQVKRLIESWLEFTNGPGGTDLSPRGKFMQDLKQQMPKPVTIPVLVVAGEVKDFASCMAKQVLDNTLRRAMAGYQSLKGFIPSIQAEVIRAVSEDAGLSPLLSELKPAWNRLVASGQPNDLLIPVSSQLGHGLIQGEKVTGQNITWGNYVHTEELLTQPMFDKEVEFIKNFINNSNKN